MIHRNFLTIREDGVYLTGYALPLSPTERQLLTLICTDPCPTSDRLLAAMDRDMTRTCLNVHLAAINRKAMAVSGRRLLMMTDGIHHLNPHM